MEALTAAPTSNASTAAAGRLTGLSAKKTALKDEPPELRAACEQFAGFFLGQLLKNMRGEMPTDGLGFGGRGEETFRELLDDEMGNQVGRGACYGLSELIHQSLVRRQGLAGAAGGSEK